MTEVVMPSVLLVASQSPQQELGVLAQVLQSQGFVQEAPGKKGAPSLRFSTPDKANTVGIKYFQELGTLRLELVGETSLRIASALTEYLDTLTVEGLLTRFEAAASDMERRVYAILVVLAFPDGRSAMRALKADFVVAGTEAAREGFVQGLAFLETPDVGEVLEEIERDCVGEPVAKLARKAIDALSERGLIRESLPSFRIKVTNRLADKPQEALDLIDAYVGDDVAMGAALRALRAAALQGLKRYDEAAEILAFIGPTDPDAAQAYIERALLRESTGFGAEALEDIRCALACEPDDAKALAIYERLELIVSRDTASNSDQIAQLSAAIAGHPNDAKLYIQRAELLLKEERYAEANNDLNDAHKLAITDPRLATLRAEAFLGMGFLGSALQEAVLALTSHSPQQAKTAQLLKARVYLALNLADRALSAVRELAPDWQSLPEAQLCQAICLELLGRDVEARAKYEGIVDIQAHLQILKPTLYKALPILQSFVPELELSLSPELSGVLGEELLDPYFKRCAACGELTIKRRTVCRNCSSESFFE